MGPTPSPRCTRRSRERSREPRYSHFRIHRSSVRAPLRRSRTLPRTISAKYISKKKKNSITLPIYDKSIELDDDGLFPPSSTRPPKHNLRNNIEVVYNTALPVIFGVKKYADSLWDVCKQRNIVVNLQTSLLKVDPNKRQATFEKLNSPGETTVREVRLSPLKDVGKRLNFIGAHYYVGAIQIDIDTLVFASSRDATDGTSRGLEGASRADQRGWFPQHRS